MSIREVQVTFDCADPGALLHPDSALPLVVRIGTSDADATREAFNALGIAFEDHDPTGAEPTGLSISDVVAGRQG